MSTVGELLIEKKTNFYNYLCEVIENEEIKKHITDKEMTKFKYCINKLNIVPIENFIFFIQKDSIPNKENLDNYVNTFLIVNGISQNSVLFGNESPDFFKQCKEKVKKYIKLFIDILEFNYDE